MNKKNFFITLSEIRIKPFLLVVILAFITGLGLLYYSQTLLYYKDPNAANILHFNVENIDKQDFDRQEAELRTNKIPLLGLGVGLATASAAILLLLFLTKSRKIADFKHTNTFSRRMIFLISNLVWFLFIPGRFWYYDFRYLRGDFPPNADSIGIPILSESIMLLFLLIPLNIFLFLTTVKAHLPTRLWVRADKYSISAVLWEIFFGFWLIVNLLYSLNFALHSDIYSIPVNLFFTFVLLNLRAGQISKYVQKLPESVRLNL